MKKLIAPIEKVKSTVIGFDVHKSLIVYSMLDRKGEENACGRFQSSRGGLEKFLGDQVGRKKVHFAFEAGRSSMWVHELLTEKYGAERVHVAQAKKIRAIANSQDKNDFNDAWWLAYLAREGRLPTAYIPPREYVELRLATRERRTLVRRRAQVFSRVRGHLAQMGLSLPASSVHVLESRTFLKAVIEETTGHRSHALQSCLDEIDFLDTSITRWDDRIKEASTSLPAVAVLAREIPGVGAVLAATIIAETGEIERFSTAKAFGRYAGLTPSDRSSGGRTIHGAITREGSPHLRWALTQAAMICLRCGRGPGRAVGDWIRAHQKRMGHHKKAKVAAARKLAETIWRLFHYGEGFDAAKAFGGTRESA
jgi:transposase